MSSVDENENENVLNIVHELEHIMDLITNQSTTEENDIHPQAGKIIIQTIEITHKPDGSIVETSKSKETIQLT